MRAKGAAVALRARLRRNVNAKWVPGQLAA